MKKLNKYKHYEAVRILDAIEWLCFENVLRCFCSSLFLVILSKPLGASEESLQFYVRMSFGAIEWLCFENALRCFVPQHDKKEDWRCFVPQHDKKKTPSPYHLPVILRNEGSLHLMHGSSLFY